MIANHGILAVEAKDWNKSKDIDGVASCSTLLELASYYYKLYGIFDKILFCLWSKSSLGSNRVAEKEATKKASLFGYRLNYNDVMSSSFNLTRTLNIIKVGLACYLRAPAVFGRPFVLFFSNDLASGSTFTMEG